MLPFQDPFRYTVVLSGIPVFPIFSLPGLKISSLLLKSLHHLNYSLILIRGAERDVMKNGGSKGCRCKYLGGKSEATERRVFLLDFGHSGCSALRVCPIPGRRWGGRMAGLEVSPASSLCAAFYLNSKSL